MTPSNLAGCDDVSISPGRELTKTMGKLGLMPPEKQTAICELSRPLTLLDLPHDVLEQILKEVKVSTNQISVPCLY